MSRQLGFFDDEIRDFPELNKCPDCETFFAEAYCPLCGKLCPEEMRAGNRPAPKKEKRHRTGGNGRVQFVPWYHSAWFIVLMLFAMPIVGLILLWSSHWRKYWKITVTAVLIVGYLLVTVGIPFLMMFVLGGYSVEQNPITIGLTEEEYQARCETVSPELLYRHVSDMKNDFVTLHGVIERIHDVNDYEEILRYYTLTVTDTSGKEWQFLVRDCREQSAFNLAVGDEITLWGEVGGNKTIYASDTAVTLPNVNMAYVKLH